MAENQVPGTIGVSNGSWHWRVRLPCDARRRDILLTFPFSGRRIPADTDRYSFEAAEDEALREASPAALQLG